MSNNRPLDCQTTLRLPVKQSLDYGYGLSNNVITLKIPIKNMDLKIELNITIGDIFKMDHTTVLHSIKMKNNKERFWSPEQTLWREFEELKATIT